jgi:hypothetical protein
MIRLAVRFGVGVVAAVVAVVAAVAVLEGTLAEDEPTDVALG